MEKIDFSFEDVPVQKFCYSSINKRIEVYFAHSYDSITNQHVERPWVLIIEGWQDASSRNDGAAKPSDLNRHMGVFDMLLSMEQIDGWLKLYVNTMDNRYVEFAFKHPQFSGICEVML